MDEDESCADGWLLSSLHFLLFPLNPSPFDSFLSFLLFFLDSSTHHESEGCHFVPSE